MLSTPGKRLYAVIALAALAYVAVHLGVGLYLVGASAGRGSWFTAGLAATTIATALLGALHVAQLTVYSAVMLFRGRRPFVKPPPVIAEEDLPPLVVQVPGRNEPLDAVVRSIESVLASQYPRDKLRVQHVDNSDDERWRAVADRYAADDRVEVVHRTGTQGYKAGNLNLGLLLLGMAADARDVLVGLLDVGDTFAPRALRLMATELVLDPRLAFVQSLTKIGNPGETAITRVESFVTDAMFRFHFGLQNTYGTPVIYGHNALIRREALLDVGGWDETKIAEDWATAVAMLVEGWRGKWVDYDPLDPSIVSTEDAPSTLEGQQRQKSRWAVGGSELLKQDLPEWMRASLPWHQKLDLVIRCLTYPTALPRYIGMLLMPLWIGMAALAYEAPAPVVWFGLASASLQNAVFLFVLAAAAIYAAEGNPKRGAALLVCFPLQVAYSLSVAPYIGRGVLKGLRYAKNVFVVTPKAAERIGLARALAQQRVALLLTAWMLLPAAAVAFLGPDGYRSYVPPLLVIPALSVVGICLVPVTQWMRSVAPHLRSKRPARSADSEAPERLEAPDSADRDDSVS